MSAGNNMLIVEDDVLVRHPLAEYLRECGFRVAEAAHADEARQLLLKQTPGGAIDYVLVHAQSETDRGFTLANWIRSKFPAIQVILAGSVSATADQAGHLCKEGPALTKPYDHKLVLAHIRRMQAARDRSKGE